MILAEAAVAVLTTASPTGKIELTRQATAAWREGRFAAVGRHPPDRPARPEHPALLPPRDMAKRSRAASLKGRVALLHALAHIELNAIDLAWDIIARFPDEAMPAAFFDDWVAGGQRQLPFRVAGGRLAELALITGFPSQRWSVAGGGWTLPMIWRAHGGGADGPGGVWT